MITVLEIVNIICSSAKTHRQFRNSVEELDKDYSNIILYIYIITALFGGCQAVMFSRDLWISMNLSVDFLKKN